MTHLKSGIAAIALIATALSVLPATAQSPGFTGNPDTVMVTPDGRIIDYVPADADVYVRVNNRGRRLLVDGAGRVLAREMGRARYERMFGLAAPQPSLGDDFFPDAPQRLAETPADTDLFAPDSGDVTGSIPEMDDGTGADQPLPDALPDALPADGTQDLGLDDPNAEALPAREPDYEVLSLKGMSRAEITALQVFLDRQGISPGVIDGKAGSNVSKAVDAWQKMTGETLDYKNTEEILTRLGYEGGLPIISYTITPADAAGPYVAAIPEDYAHKAMLPSMAFTSVTEALAERFHMDEAYLKELNPGVDFTIPGTIIKVVNPGEPKKFQVSKIIADKVRKQVFAYDEAGTLVAAYPASIGSSDTPSPSGLHSVARVALDPNYTYNPKINFQQGNNTKVLTIPPGPNGPVGTVWIALSKPTYGIHGTPEPSKIGKSQSHGCIRLTNWDARELAKMVKPGVTVEFLD